MEDREEQVGRESGVDASSDPATESKAGAESEAGAEPAEHVVEATGDDPGPDAGPREGADAASDGGAATESDGPFARVPAPLDRALIERGFDGLTPVQAAILEADEGGRELQVSSQTGSGKTVGLGFVLAQAARDGLAAADATGPLALVICPTRELAQQVSTELRWLYAALGEGAVRPTLSVVTGGTPVFRDRRLLDPAPAVLVGTPGRLLDHVRGGLLDLSLTREVVLDEADQMLDMGFREDLEALLDATADERRVHLVSATFPDEIVGLARRYQSDPLRVEGTPLGDANADIEHIGNLVRPHDRYAALVNHLLLAGRQKTLVFVERRADAADLAQQLESDGFAALPISGDLVQAQRDRALAAFRDGRVTILVATDVAARGIDVPDVALVVQTSPPIDPETYTHRAGRTGRAGRSGRCLLFAPPRRRRHVERLLADASVDVQWRDVPSADEVRAFVDAEARAVAARRVEAALERGAKDQHREAARELMEKHDPVELLASLLSAIEPRRRARAVDVDGGDGHQGGGQRAYGRGDGAGGRGGGSAPSASSVRFFMNYGANQGATAGRVLASVCRRGEVPGEAVGSISIHPNATTFDISAELAEDFEARVGQRDPRDPQTFIRRDRGPGGGARRRGGGPRRRGYGARRRRR